MAERKPPKRHSGRRTAPAEPATGKAGKSGLPARRSSTPAAIERAVAKRSAPRVVPASSGPAPTLGEVRTRIDGIDAQIQGLIAERARWAQQVGRAKGKLAAAVDYYRPEREAQVLRQVVDRNDGPLADDVLLRLFREIMSACLAQQEPLRVGYLGPEGTFSMQAALRHFGHSIKALPMASIEEVFQEVEAGHADFGVVPVENSGQGTIQSTLDMFLASNVRICGEVELRVHQYLLARSGQLEGIERVYSHPMSLAQCRGWLRQHLPRVETVPVASNAEAARRARNADDAAAIAGEAAGLAYGLKVVAGPIEDRDDNTTRFLVLGRSAFPASGNDRTSLLIFIRDQPGALYQILEPLARRGISMNRIESRPAHTGLWHYAFFIDVGGHADEAPLKDALAEMHQAAGEVRVLGSYPVALP